MLKKEMNLRWYWTTMSVPRTAEEIAEVSKKAIFGSTFVSPTKGVVAFELKDPKKNISWKPIEEGIYKQCMAAAEITPQCHWHSDNGSRYYWFFQKEFWSTTEELTPEQVKALILQKRISRDKQIKRAMAAVNVNMIGNNAYRQPIPDDVKVFVWQRDGGKCVQCGATENLEFDHIIPLAKGGSNTARNLQLLCADCNQEKGPNLF